MDALAQPVVESMGTEIQELVAKRRERFGLAQSRLFWGGVFTDDVILLLKGARLAAIGAREWDISCARCEIEMETFNKRGAGTAPLHIGGRFVLNGHFGVLPPAKRVRCLAGIRDSLEHRIQRDAYDSLCGLLGHATDLLHLDRSLLHGIKRPLQHAHYPDSAIHITFQVAARFFELEFAISTRGAASFASAVPDADVLLPMPGSVTPRRTVMGSD